MPKLPPLPSQRDVLACRSVYGNPSNPKNHSVGSPSWESSNLAVLKVPFRMTFAGAPVKGLRLHKYCHPHFAYLFELLMRYSNGSQEVLDRWGVTKTGGAYNYRTMRGLNTLSMHSFGCAIDLDPANNGLRGPRGLGWLCPQVR